LAIIAQGSVITQSEAAGLLDQVEKALHYILETDGRNIVLGHGTVARHENDTTVSTSSQPATLDGIHDVDVETFTWTNQTKQIKTEIATLANIPEDTVHQSSSIFELGLDSIDVIKLSSRLRKQSIEIPVSTIIRCQTIAKMAANISSQSEQAQKKSTGKNLLEMSRDLTRYLRQNGKLPSNIQAVLPATPLQQSMVNEMINSGCQRYFTVEAFKISDNVDPARLMVAIQSVIRQSPILRTSFIEIEDPRSPVSYAQIINNDYSPPSTSVLAGEKSFESFMDQFRTDSAAIAAEKHALCQVHFIRAGQKQYMIIALSHALYDGRSLRALHEDIYKSYYGKLSTRPDFMPFLEQIFQSTTEDAKSFWRSALSNLPSALFPRKAASQVSETDVVHRLEKRSRVPLIDIEALCKSSRITLQTLGQTCWALVLSHLMGQLDVVFGSVLSCRDSEEADEIMFPLMNTVAVRSVLHGSLGEMVKYMQGLSDMTRQYQHFPLGMAQAYGISSCEYRFSARDATLFETLFIYQGRRPVAESDPLYDSVYGVSEVEFPVCVEMEIVDDKYLSWTIACKSNVRTAKETEDIIEDLDSVLERILSAPQAETFASSTDGISICGLTSFKKQNRQPRSNANRSTISNDGDWSSTEIYLRKALHEISGVPEDAIHKDSTIFHLGLDSILVLKLPALLRGYGIKLSVSEILREQTASSMAQFVLRSNPDEQKSLDVDGVLANAISKLDSSSELVALEKNVGEIQYIMPATAGQLYMIRQWQVSHEVQFYPTFTYSLRGPFYRPKLEAAWRAILQRNDILRTGFIEIGSKLVQVIFKSPTNEAVYDSKESRATHNLMRPPLGLTAEDCEGSSTKLTLKIHHALYDGISLPILMDELQLLYHGQIPQEQAVSLRRFVAQSISSAEKAPYERSRASQTAMQEKWTSYLKQGTFDPIQTSNSISTTNKKVKVFHPSMKVSPIKTLAQTSGVSIDALFLAAIAKIYAQRLLKLNQDTPISQVVFGIYLANRAPFGDDLSELAAPTLNLLPLCVRSPSREDLTQVAKEIQQDLHKISTAEMSCASLAEIYDWTGVRVNFFVNILKDTSPKMGSPGGSNGTGENMTFEPVQDMTKRAQVVDDVPNDSIPIPSDRKYDAYLVSLSEHSLILKGPNANHSSIFQPSVDVEIRYQRDKIDMGVFAPSHMLSVIEAESMIGAFVHFWA
jgi:aryl carrier-like protein/NRPS condensation-like uncharacterized protein